MLGGVGGVDATLLRGLQPVLFLPLSMLHVVKVQALVLMVLMALMLDQLLQTLKAERHPPLRYAVLIDVMNMMFEAAYAMAVHAGVLGLALCLEHVEQQVAVQLLQLAVPKLALLVPKLVLGRDAGPVPVPKLVLGRDAGLVPDPLVLALALPLSLALP